MPTYPYACTACDNRFEAVQSFSDDALTVCPVCGGRLRKVFSSVGVVFKGSGFYRNDSRGTGAKAGESGGRDAGAGGSKEPAPTSAPAASSSGSGGSGSGGSGSGGAGSGGSSGGSTSGGSTSGGSGGSSGGSSSGGSSSGSSTSSSGSKGSTSAA